MQDQSGDTPFRLTGTLSSLPGKSLSRSIELLLERVFSLHQLDKLYRGLTPGQDEGEFLQQVFETFNIKYQVDQDELDGIPRTGPLVVVANHPFGAIEGVIMAAILRQVRPDVKIMANFILQRIPEMRDRFIAVNPFGGKKATSDNIGSMKEAVRWLQQDSLLVVFPAGEVSHFNPRKRAVADPEWSETIGGLVRLAKAPVQTVYFHGANSLLFQLAGLMHPLLRTALLPRELINRTNTTIPVRIGKPIAYNKLRDLGDDKAVIDYLRLRTYMLCSVNNTGSPNAKFAASQESATPNIIAAVEAGLMHAEIEQLPEHQHLVDNGDMQVYYATARQVPNLVREIGRLREVSFRAVGEGSGKPVDLDFYDNFYLHLFIWNKKENEVVGAYRLGQADKILHKQGVVGLYSYSLFRYSKQLIDQINPALELGRSFVRQEYQKSFAALMLLWKGIGQYISQNPQYKNLFGPVSISGNYQPVSQQLLVEFLRANNSEPILARMVKPRKPFKSNAINKRKAKLAINHIDGVADLIAEIEKDEKGIPILLKQYLKLGGQILEFNIDDQFNNALDGLIMVDLLKTDPKSLAKYLGKTGVKRFYAYHRHQRDSTDAA